MDAALLGMPELGFGTFFGQQKSKVHLGGLCLSILAPEAWGDELPEHSHRDAHFIYPLRGKYVSTAAGFTEREAARPLIYNPPAVVHRDRFESQEGLFLGVSISGDCLAEFQSCGLPDYPIALRSSAIARAIARLREEVNIDDASSAMIIEGLCFEIIGYVGREERIRTRAKPAWINMAIEFLMDNLHRRPTATQVAHAVNVPESQVLREFQRCVGCSPGTFLRAQRMERARTLLTSSKCSLSDIALSIGFSDQSAFTKAFTRMHGFSPGVFRQSNSSDSDKKPV